MRMIETYINSINFLFKMFLVQCFTKVCFLKTGKKMFGSIFRKNDRKILIKNGRLITNLLYINKGFEWLIQEFLCCFKNIDLFTNRQLVVAPGH